MRTLPALAMLVTLGCATHARSSSREPITVWAHSQNRSDVDVYLLCGKSDATRLGTVHEHDEGSFDIPASRALCGRGLNFFVVVRAVNRGYWVGPLHPRAGVQLDLAIERYAGLSSVRQISALPRAGVGPVGDAGAQSPGRSPAPP